MGCEVEPGLVHRVGEGAGCGVADKAAACLCGVPFRMCASRWMVGAEGGRLNRYPTLAGHRRDRLIEQGQVVVGYVHNLEPTCSRSLC